MLKIVKDITKYANISFLLQGPTVLKPFFAVKNQFRKLSPKSFTKYGQRFHFKIVFFKIFLQQIGLICFH